jgi:hypothetical protein
MAKIWQERGGFELTENRLAKQARTIIRKQWLTKEELDEIRIRETEDRGAQAIEEGQATVEVIPPSVLERSYQSQGKEYHHPVRQDDIMIESRLSYEKKESVEEVKIQRGRLQMGREKLTNIRHIHRRKIVEELRKINKVIEHVPIDHITELNDTFYTGAAIVTKKLAKNRSEKKDEPPWKKRLKEKVTELRKNISRVVKARNEPHNDRFRRKI